MVNPVSIVDKFSYHPVHFAYKCNKTDNIRIKHESYEGSSAAFGIGVTPITDRFSNVKRAQTKALLGRGPETVNFQRQETECFFFLLQLFFVFILCGERVRKRKKERISNLTDWPINCIFEFRTQLSLICKLINRLKLYLYNTDILFYLKIIWIDDFRINLIFSHMKNAKFSDLVDTSDDRNKRNTHILYRGGVGGGRAPTPRVNMKLHNSPKSRPGPCFEPGADKLCGKFAVQPPLAISSTRPCCCLVFIGTFQNSESGERPLEGQVDGFVLSLPTFLFRWVFHMFLYIFLIEIKIV